MCVRKITKIKNMENYLYHDNMIMSSGTVTTNEMLIGSTSRIQNRTYASLLVLCSDACLNIWTSVYNFIQIIPQFE